MESFLVSGLARNWQHRLCFRMSWGADSPARSPLILTPAGPTRETEELEKVGPCPLPHSHPAQGFLTPRLTWVPLGPSPALPWQEPRSCLLDPSIISFHPALWEGSVCGPAPHHSGVLPNQGTSHCLTPTLLGDTQVAGRVCGSHMGLLILWT